MNINNANKNKLKIWSNVLVEQTLCENIDSFGLTQITDQVNDKQRGVETYVYNKEPNSTNNKTNHQNDADQPKHRLQEQREIKDRLGPLIKFDENKSRTHIRVTELDTDELVIREIARCLEEPNIDVITRCVRVLGKKKSLELLYATEDIVQTGGMLTSDGFRRRTPGGTYLQLVKIDQTILKCQKKQILILEDYQKQKKNKIKRYNFINETKFCYLKHKIK
jgi:hypothetical protein